MTAVDDGWGALLIIFVIAAIAGGAQTYDKIRGRYPRDWRD